MYSIHGWLTPAYARCQETAWRVGFYVNLSRLLCVVLLLLCTASPESP
jgi:hypothetical protein